MAASSFDPWCEFAFGVSETSPGGKEGGFNADDPSRENPTWRGIELSEWRDWRHDQTLTADDMRDLLRLSEIKEISHENYWNVVNGDGLPAGVDVLLSDHALNAGPETTAILLQRMLDVRVDGKIGPITLLALRGFGTPGQSIIKIRNKMEADYRSDRKFPEDGNGWLARLNICTALAIKLAAAASIAPIGAVSQT
jgi:lysozyme family protein